jgi:RNA polymerase sigma-54 factor
MLQQTQSQRQTLKFSPLQIQFLNFLQLSTIELESYIKNELEENPALEEGSSEEIPENSAESEWEEGSPEVAEQRQDEIVYDWETLDNDEIPDYRTRSDNYASQDDESYSTPLVQSKTFREELSEQLHWLNMSERQLGLADFILHSLDEDGFLHFSLEDLADDLSFAHNTFVEVTELEEILGIIQQLDPPGVGARDIQECLMLQLKARTATGEDTDWASRLVGGYSREIIQKNYNTLVREPGIGQEDFRHAIQQISHLNPKPVTGMGGDSFSTHPLGIYPELVLNYNEGHIEVSLNGKNAPELRLNPSLMAMAENAPRTAVQFVKSKIQAARWLMDAIKQRETTMIRVMKAMVSLQSDYFLSGDLKKLKPMILKDVADLIQMDISTVSRVTSNKYVQTPFGIVLLKGLFSEGVVNREGKEVSNREIQQTIVEVVSLEDKSQPLNDQQIAALLLEKGYPIARRTVAKYREHLNIPAAPLRREWA